MEFILYFMLGVAIYVPAFYVIDHYTGGRKPRSLNRILAVIILLAVFYVLTRVTGADALTAVSLLLAYLASSLILNAIYRRQIKQRAEREAVDS